jgi:hypothetical protein
MENKTTGGKWVVQYTVHSFAFGIDLPFVMKVDAKDAADAEAKARANSSCAENIKVMGQEQVR